MKTCSYCKKRRANKSFGADARSTTGLRSNCRFCERGSTKWMKTTANGSTLTGSGITESTAPVFLSLDADAELRGSASPSTWKRQAPPISHRCRSL